MDNSRYKFRAWIYDRDLKKGFMYYAKDFCNSEAELLSFFNEKCTEEEGDSLMQFTGRKDKNGKEAYGGDIVKFPNHEYLAEIKYYPEFAAFLFDSHNDKTRNNPNAQMLWRDAFEIIGNIHEHPKLLEANSG